MIRKNFPLAFTGVIFFSLLSWQCTKIDTTTIGGGLIPAVDNLNTFDTILSVIANNHDSIPFNKECAIVYPTDDHVLGYIGNDPYFGTTKATIYTELKSLVFPFYFQAKPMERTLDSIVLVLSYQKTYGDSNTAQRVEVHQINTVFNPDSSTCTSYPFDAAVLGSATFLPKRLIDSVKAVGDTSNRQLRIKLSNTFGQLLLSQDTIKTDSAFRVLLKGFAIVPDNMGNAINYFSITDTKTKLAIYYKYKRTGLSDTTGITYFSLYPGSKSANSIVRNRAGSEINSVSNNASNPAGDNFIYIQTTPGSFAQLKIPAISTLSNRIIHRAELIMEQAPVTGVDNFLTAPGFLFLDIKDSIYHPVPCDFGAPGGSPDLATYGGFKVAAKDAAGKDIARYVFNISRYVQKIITNKRVNATLRLRAPDYLTIPKAYLDECFNAIPPFAILLNNVANGRVKLVGGTSTAVPNRIRLRIVYSRI